MVVVSRNTQDPDFNPVGNPFLEKRLRLVTSYAFPAESARWSKTRSFALTLDLLAHGGQLVGAQAVELVEAAEGARLDEADEHAAHGEEVQVVGALRGRGWCNAGRRHGAHGGGVAGGCQAHRTAGTAST